jgi:hypothetical protein
MIEDGIAFLFVVSGRLGLKLRRLQAEGVTVMGRSDGIEKEERRASKPLRVRGPVPLSFATSGAARDFRGDGIRDNRADHEDRRFAPGRRLFERLMTRTFFGSGVLIAAARSLGPR